MLTLPESYQTLEYIIQLLYLKHFGNGPLTYRIINGSEFKNPEIDMIAFEKVMHDQGGI